MLVIVSWVSFWLDANAVPARVSLGVTTLLTMATQTTGINNSLPPVSYTKVSIISFHLWVFYRQYITGKLPKGPGIYWDKEGNNLDSVLSFYGRLYYTIDSLFTGLEIFFLAQHIVANYEIFAFFSRYDASKHSLQH